MTQVSRGDNWAPRSEASRSSATGTRAWRSSLVAAVRPCLQVQPLVEPEGRQLDHGVGGDVAGQDGQVEPLVRGQRLEELGQRRRRRSRPGRAGRAAAASSASRRSSTAGMWAGSSSFSRSRYSRTIWGSVLPLIETRCVGASPSTAATARSKTAPLTSPALHQGPVYIEEQQSPYGHTSPY